MTKISGYVCIRNGLDLDYCFEDAVKALIPVCDEVVVCDSDSTDGTTDALHALCRLDTRVRYLNRPWENPVRTLSWWTDWMNWTRERLTHPMQLQMDGDEVLDESAYDPIREIARAGGCAWFRRLNYWGSPFTLVPRHRVCGDVVVRLAPTRLFMPSDEPCRGPEREYEVRLKAGWPPEQNVDERLLIHHMGFLRRDEAMHKKVLSVNTAFFGETDARLVKAKADGKPWQEYVHFDGEELRPYKGGHPEAVVQWCRQRGYKI